MKEFTLGIPYRQELITSHRDWRFLLAYHNLPLVHDTCQHTNLFCTWRPTAETLILAW